MRIVRIVAFVLFVRNVRFDVLRVCERRKSNKSNNYAFGFYLFS